MKTKMMNKEPVFTRGFATLTVAAICALITLVILGSWQVKRLFWKEALIARVESQIGSSPISIDSAVRVISEQPESVAKLEYQPVNVRGRFDHDKEYFYFATLNGTVGWHVYSPLMIEGADGRIVFVNRGFVPGDRKSIATRPESRTDDFVRVSGLFRWPDDEKPNFFTPENDADANIFFWRELGLMRKLAGYDEQSVLPFFVYAKKNSDGRLPIGGVTIINFPNRHLSYALTWYGLGLTLIGVYMALLWSRMKRQGNPGKDIKNVLVD